MSNYILEKELFIMKKFMIELANESGLVIKKYFKKNLEIEKKLDKTEVTIADKQTEEKIRSMIEDKFPAHGILGEEFGVKNPDSPWQWVIDPIDGTKSFISGSLDFGTIIGLTYEKKPLLGMIHQPILNEIILGDNKTTTLNSRTIKVSSIGSLSEATVLAYDFELIAKKTPGLNLLRKEAKMLRTWGNCFGYGLIAQGFCHGMLDPTLAPWDIAGIIPIIRGAGGIVSDYSGNQENITDSMIACCPGIFHELLKTIHEKF